VEIARQEIQRLLADLKSQGQHLHVGLSGGRRAMGLLMALAAAQYLTPVDELWHIHTSPELTALARDGAVMHAPPGEEVQLIPVPFVPWVSYFPGLEPLLKQSAQQMGEARHYWLDHTERARCAQVWDALSRRQRDALSAFAAGHQRKEVAGLLNISIHTVDDHFQAIGQECSKAWTLEEKLRFDAHFLRERFGPFLEGLKQV
jgi:DNA-binding CsgD family transcriptional regulator